jgi:hypothetical protein
MKFTIVVEDRMLGITKIPLSPREVNALGDLGFMIEKDLWRTLKLNKIDREVASAMRKFQHLLFDVKDGGRTYTRQDGKWVLHPTRTWIVKKLRWKKRTRSGRRRVRK